MSLWPFSEAAHIGWKERKIKKRDASDAIDESILASIGRRERDPVDY